MRYAALSYAAGQNLGDDIQTLAAEQYLPRVDARIDRDTMHDLELGEPHVVIMNGWFSLTPKRCFPPSLDIVPVFIGFHIAEEPEVERHYLSGESLDYLRKHAPIGCRDEATRDLLEAAGVAAHKTLCLTTTFPRRKGPAEGGGRVFIVDGDGLPIPRALRRDAQRVTHVTQPLFDAETKRSMAQQLLDAYRDHASLVITTRLHCALPCLAMGVPVVFFGDPSDRRLGPLRDLGVTIHPRPRPGRIRRVLRRRPTIYDRWAERTSRGIDWEPEPIDIENQKATLRRLTQETLRERTEGLSVPNSDVRGGRSG